jgi:predicted DNA-binding transcriptional regulator AlpA
MAAPMPVFSQLRFRMTQRAPMFFATTKDTEMNNKPDVDTLVPIRTVLSRLSRSRASLYRDIQRGDFPAPVKCGGSSRWFLSDIEEHLKALRSERDS